MELCSVCSELDLHRRFREEQILGPYDELLLRSYSVGPSRGGCGGCAFFCALLRNSGRWCNRILGLSGRIIILQNQGLVARASSEPTDISQQPDSDLLLGICTEEDRTGVLQCDSERFNH